MLSRLRAVALATLPLAAVSLSFTLAPACSSTDSPAPAETPDAEVEDAGNGGDGLAPPPISRTKDEAELFASRKACAFKAGAWAAETIGKDVPVGSDIPINHVIVIMQENRSFDHYLGQLVAKGYYKPGDFHEPGVTYPHPTAAVADAGSDAAEDASAGDADAAVDAEIPDDTRGSGFDHSDQLDGPPADWGNLDSNGKVIVPHPDTENCYGVNHSWQSMHAHYDDGKLDHFVVENDPNGQRSFYYQDDTIIPFYYALATTFSVGDRYFASVLGPTWPNRLHLMAATSFGIADNSFVTLDTNAAFAPQIFSLLEAAGRSWKDYTNGPHQVAFFPAFGFRKETRDRLGSVKCTLLEDIASDTLPDVSFVMGDEVNETSDEGPSALPGIGGQVVEGIIRALFASKSWKDTAVFITYDENGGTADHVRPAPACPADDYPPHDTDGKTLAGKFDTTGFRVPFIVVSPYARAHYASHVVHDHTSITRFIEARFGLPALSARDANATPPYEMFDFKNPPFMTPPDIAAKTTVDPAVLAKCKQSLAPLTCQQ